MLCLLSASGLWRQFSRLKSNMAGLLSCRTAFPENADLYNHVHRAEIGVAASIRRQRDTQAGRCGGDQAVWDGMARGGGGRLVLADVRRIRFGKP
ncbi:MAG: hypothetical protein MUC58_13625 [Rhizobiaceae bacterium]|nr:hypothetical protein [Rhizobiaceae bacterium]